MSTLTKLSIPEDLLNQFSDLLSDKMGLYYPPERWADLEKKMQSVMDSLGYEDAGECMRALLNAPIEKDKIALLAYHLTIGETYFFRDGRMFHVLEKEVLPGIIDKHQMDRRIRIWSAGCCTGEEPYSLAILLHRLIPDKLQWKIQIIGTDINQEFIKRAQEAVYKKWSFRAISDEDFKRYFHQAGEGAYRLIPEIRKMVEFDFLNLAEPKFLEGRPRLLDADLILCNNVLIYFSQKQISKTIHQMSQSLAEGGWLVVSSIEVPFVEDAHLSKFHFPGAILFKKQLREPKRQAGFANAKTAVLPDKTPLTKPHLPNKAGCEASSVPKKPVHQTSPIKECLTLNHQKKYAEAIALLEGYIGTQEKNGAIPPACIPEVHLLIRAYANQGQLPLAHQWCQKALKADKLDPSLYYLQATIQMDQEDNKEAMASLRKALFLEPNFIVAHHMLGVLEERMGNRKAAIRSYENALDGLEHFKNEDVLPGTDNITAGHLKEVLAHLLRRP